MSSASEAIITSSAGPGLRMMQNSQAIARVAKRTVLPAAGCELLGIDEPIGQRIAGVLNPRAQGRPVRNSRRVFGAGCGVIREWW